MAGSAQETLDRFERGGARDRKRGDEGQRADGEGLSLLQREVYGLLMIVTGLVVLLALFSYSADDLAPGSGTATANWIGPVGASIAHTFLGGVGLIAFPLVLTLVIAGVRLMRGLPVALTGGGVGAYLAAVLALTVLVQVVASGRRAFEHPLGGVIGLYVGEVSRALVSTAGTVLIFGALLLVAVAMLTRRPLRVLLGPLLVQLVAAFRRAGEYRPWRGSPSEEGADGEGAEEEGADGAPDAGAPGDGLTYDRDAGAVRRGPRIGRAPKPDAEVSGADSAGDGPQPGREGVGLTGDEDVPEDAVALAPAAAAAPAGARTAATAAPNAPTAQKAGPRIVESEAMRAPTQLDLIPQGRRAVRPSPLAEYELPDLSLLDYEPPRDRDIDEEYLRENARRLEEKLADFNVRGEVVEIHPGPVVTTYEFRPAPGIKISRIQSLSDDLTMALAAQRVRIIAPIPGKAVVGIEVPNRNREIVYLREVLASKAFQEAKHKLTLVLGKDIVGHPTVANLAKMPHLLVAGSTGSGKSVAINAFILSVLFRANPDEVKMIMVDPKMLELTVYQGIPHLLLPVVTDPKDAAVALKWAVMEMERRYRLMSQYGVRNIVSFNKRVEELRREYEETKRVLAEADAAQAFEESGWLDEDEDHDEPLDPGAVQKGTAIANSIRGAETDEEDDGPPEGFPYIVVIVDELADLMMVASKDVETSIARLAQMARACGIHLILATQRPSVDVITGLIKANFPTRMSFQVASKTDSRTILDQGGAEALLGMGDMLFMPPGTSAVDRNHGAFVSDEEVRRVVDCIKAQRRAEYDMDILKTEDGGQGDFEDEEYDEFYDQAVAIVAETRQASISYLQRRLKIGYNRAARIVEVMEREGLVGPADGSKPREVFIDPV